MWNKCSLILVLCHVVNLFFACVCFKILIYFSFINLGNLTLKQSSFLILFIITVFLISGCTSSRQFVAPTLSRPDYNMAALDQIIDGAIMELLEHPREALSYYHHAAELDSASAGIYVTMAENYFKIKEADVSINLAKKALRLDPENINALYILALSYEAEKEYIKSMAVYEDIVKLRPTDIEALYYLTSLQVISGLPKKALKAYKQMTKIGFNEPGFLLNVGNLFLSHQAVDQAEYIYNDILADYPETEAPYLALAQTGKAKGDTAIAIQWYKKGLQQNPQFKDCREELRRIYENHRDWNAAIAMFEGLVEADSSNLSNKLKLGQYHFLNKDLQKSRDVYESAVKNHPQSERAYVALSALCVEQGDTLAAIQTLETAINDKKSFYRARAQLRDIYVVQQRWDDAIALYEPLKDNDTTFVGARIEIAHLLVSKGDTAQAVLNLESLMQSHSDDWRVPLTLGRFYFLRGQDSKSAEKFKRALELKDDMPELWVLQGLSYVRQDSLELALKNYLDALKKFPKNPEINYYAGNVLSQQKKFARALSYYNTALENDPHNHQVALALAGAYDELKQYDRAEVLYRKLVAANPNSPIVLNNYAYHLSVQAKELEKALDFSKKAVEAVPENGPYLDTLGWIYYQMGDYQRAKEYIELALEKSPGAAEVIEHLGDVYEKLGDQAMAEKFWQQAFELDDRRLRLREKLGR